MSRIGKQPISIPAGVKVAVNGGVVSVEGPKGKLNFTLGSGVLATTQEGKIIFTVAPGSPQQAKANHGTARATVSNMVIGVTKGWKRGLELTGVGFVAKLQGKDLVLAVGFSHDVTLPVPAGVNCVVTKTTIDLEGPDREIVGKFASSIRMVQPPEPYLGKGIRYTNEVIRRKAGKAGKKQ